LFAGRAARDVAALTPPPAPNWTVDGAVVRTKDGKTLPGGLRPATPITVPINTEDITVNPVNRQPPAMDRDALVNGFLRNSRDMINAQRDVLLSYLGAAPSAPSTPMAPPAPVVAPAPMVSLAEPVIAAPEPEQPKEQAPRDVLATVIEAIAQRSGYPTEMISQELDLEADLSIDSIKRTEIAGGLVAALGLTEPDMETLTKARTPAAIADVLSGWLGGPSQTAAPVVPEPVVAEEPSALVEAPQRYVLELVDAAVAAEAEPAALLGANVVISGGDAALAEQLAGDLSARGAMPFVIGHAEEIPITIARVDVFVSLHATDGDPDTMPVLPATYPLLRAALAREPRCVLAVAPAGDVVPRRSAGLRGFYRTVAQEHQDVAVRLVELDTATGVEVVSAALVDELHTYGNDPVVIRSNDRRQVFRMVPAPFGSLATGGAGPAGIGAAEAAAMGLDPDSVVLLLGGARGITAQVALAIAGATGCRIELAGRTPLPTEEEPAEVAAAGDLTALRGVLARAGAGGPAEIEQAAREILAQREVADTLRQLRAMGNAVEYHPVD
ncbi:MAG: phosphopantetheine-binding protein, partial [Thermocrispum sp.]